jgi:hypothetical protein
MTKEKLTKSEWVFLGVLIAAGILILISYFNFYSTYKATFFTY